jgi:hypothetical protein
VRACEPFSFPLVKKREEEDVQIHQTSEGEFRISHQADIAA